MNAYLECIEERQGNKKINFHHCFVASEREEPV